MHIFPKSSFFPGRKKGEVLALFFLPSLGHEMWGEAANTESGKKPLPPPSYCFPLHGPPEPLF